MKKGEKVDVEVLQYDNGDWRYDISGASVFNCWLFSTDYLYKSEEFVKNMD